MTGRFVSTRALTFDDVLLVPKFSDIESRNDVDISTKLGPSLSLDIPILSAPMDSVTEWELASEMITLGCGGIIHRYNTIEEQSTLLEKTIGSFFDKVDRKYPERETNFIVGITVGVKNKDESLSRIEASLNKIQNDFIRKNRFLITIDIAHGDHKKVLNLAQEIKKLFPDVSLCAGNICTLDAAKRYKDAGIDIGKIGIGGGATCNTRSSTGCGYPQLSMIQEIAWKADLPIIADGAIKNSGDIVKALAAGADAVMIGSLLAGCPESCAQQIQDEKGNKFKLYRGMASYSAKKDHQINDTYVEGESVLKRLGPSVKEVIERLSAGIRSGLSYVGARNLGDLQSKAEFIEVSNGTQLENSIRNM